MTVKRRAKIKKSGYRLKVTDKKGTVYSERFKTRQSAGKVARSMRKADERYNKLFGKRVKLNIRVVKA